MRRSALCTGLVLGLALIVTASASAEVILFHVDGELVAEIPSSTPPAARRIKVAGRSGGDGTFERSGLYDNVYVEIDGRAVVCDDPFDVLDTGYWVLYGSPDSQLLMDFGLPEPCLMTAGDNWNDSGLYSLQTFDWSGGFVFEADVLVSEAAAYHSAEFGIADRDLPEGEQFGHVIGVNWKTSGSGDYYLQCNTDLETVYAEAPTPGEWHRIRVSSVPSPPTISVYFWLDDVLVAELPSFVQPTARPIKIAGRSGSSGNNERSGLYDNVFVYANGGAFVRVDEFATLDTGFWGTYGSPTPHILGDFGNPLPCLMTSGDSVYDSGLYSLGLFDWSQGFQIEIDGHVAAAASYHSVEFGVADRNEPENNQFGHVIGVNWKRTGAGDYILQCNTELDEERPPGPTPGEWHAIIVTTYDPPLERPTSPVELSTWGAIKGLYR